MNDQEKTHEHVIVDLVLFFMEQLDKLPAPLRDLDPDYLLLKDRIGDDLRSAVTKYCVKRPDIVPLNEKIQVRRTHGTYRRWLKADLQMHIINCADALNSANQLASILSKYDPGLAIDEIRIVKIAQAEPSAMQSCE